MAQKKSRKRTSFLGIALAGAALLALAIPVQAQRRWRPRANWGRARPKALKIGQIAPDFELPILKFEKRKDGSVAGRITDKKVKLSSFRGKKAVVLFFSSYT